MAAPPLVHCADCAREWRSTTMAEGLRLVGCCPRCSGQLVWTSDAMTTTSALPASPVAPHLVLGLPRR